MPNGIDVLNLAHRKAYRFRIVENGNGKHYAFDKSTMLGFARALLDKHRTPPARPSAGFLLDEWVTQLIDLTARDWGTT